MFEIIINLQTTLMFTYGDLKTFLGETPTSLLGKE
jgi:hypothetical protein